MFEGLPPCIGRANKGTALDTLVDSVTSSSVRIKNLNSGFCTSNGNQNSTSALLVTDAQRWPAMPTTRTTGTILSSGKRVSHECTSETIRTPQTDVHEVCVSSLMIQEIKKIIKESEIMKYARRTKPGLEHKY